MAAPPLKSPLHCRCPYYSSSRSSRRSPRHMDVPRSHGEEQVPRLCQLGQAVGHILQGGTVLRTGNAAGQVLGGDPQSVRLPGGKDLRQEHLVRQLEHLHEVVKELLGPGVGVGAGRHRPPGRTPGFSRWTAGPAAPRGGGRSRRRAPPRGTPPSRSKRRPAPVKAWSPS